MRLPKISEKKFVALIFIFNLILRLFILSSPSRAYFDEKIYYLNAVRDILAGKADPNFQHPPLAKELMAFGIKFFGDNPWGWRSFQAILASVAVVCVYFLAKRLFNNRAIASITAFLMTIEFSWFVLSRLAIPEMFMISFFTFSLFFLIKFYKERDNLSLVFGSVFFGLAVACKWAPLIFLPIIIYVFLAKFKLSKIAKLQIFVIAVLIVVASYLAPFFLMPKHYTIGDVINSHVKALNFHLFEEKKLVQKTPTFATSAVFWPVDVYFINLEKAGNSSIASVVFFYNPAILWTGLILSFFILKHFLKSRKVDTRLFLVSSFLIFWLPWFVSPRDTYPYYWAIGIPFAAILVAEFLVRNLKKYKLEVGAFLLAGGILFGLFYPIMTNIPVKAWYLGLLTGIGFK